MISVSENDFLPSAVCIKISVKAINKAKTASGLFKLCSTLCVSSAILHICLKNVKELTQIHDTIMLSFSKVGVCCTGLKLNDTQCYF